ncbi:DNA mismatch repair protein MutS [Lacinutrix sp. Hel_I_90]|uniref:DNA mismatch repair protein MutS n=1 Tax=Lacinutrix sp. Hel_I_90 TaxID=1249999 RepID=UPI0005C99A77|nr:DNA mismatch repair protein MutS [Lacinutrix sp. Hel_I_90]
MNFKVGDVVFVLDENLSGEIIKISGNNVTLEDTNGFELIFDASEIVKQQDNSLKRDAFSGKNIAEIVSEKTPEKRRTLPKVKPKERFQPTMEVDLHIHHLVKSERGMSSHDKKMLQLDTAKHKLEFAMKKNIPKIVFIHGVGEGTLKIELEYLFGRYDNVKFYEADYKKYGQGATEVYIYQNKKANDSSY